MNLKKLLFTLPLLSMIMVGCGAEEDIRPENGESKTIVLNLGLGDANIPTRTRAENNSLINTPTYQGDSLVNKVYFQAYDTKSQPMFDEIKELPLEYGTTTATVTLPNTGTYTLVFWAQNDECEYYDRSEFPTIKLKNTDKLKNNDPSMAAFFYKVTDVHPALLDQMSIILRRAVAQINLGMDLATYSSYTSTQQPNISSVTLYDAPTSLDLLTSETSGNADLTYAASKNITNGKHTNLKIKNPTYDSSKDTDESNPERIDCAWLSMCYTFAPNHQTTLTKATFDLSNDGESTTGYLQNVLVNNVPITQNYRTNIFASLSGNISFTINTDFQWAGEDNSIVQLDADGFSKLTPEYAATFADMDVIVDLGGKTVNIPTYSTAGNNYVPIRFVCHNFTIKNGTLNNESLQILASNQVTITNVNFTGNANGQYAPLIIGPVNGTDDVQTEYATGINIENVDFTEHKGALYNILIAGSQPVIENASSISVGEGTHQIYISSSKFANFSVDGIRLVGVPDNGIVTISQNAFTGIKHAVTALDYYGQPGHAINISNIGKNENVEIDMANCSYSYDTTGAFTTTDSENYHAGFLGLSKYVIPDLNTYEWGMSSWTLQYHTITCGDSPVNSLLYGVEQSLLGLPKGLSKGYFPKEITIDDTRNVSINTESYPTGYFAE